MLEADKKVRETDKVSIEYLSSAASQKEFQNVLKSGIYKELHKRKIVSDSQLTELLGRCQRREKGND